MLVSTPPKHMLNMRITIAFPLLVMLALASSIPHLHQSVLNDEDDFWAKKPIHTTDLMAGKARTAIGPPATHIQLPATTPTSRTLCEEINEL